MLRQRRVALVESLTVDDSAPIASPVPTPRYQFGNNLGSVALELDGSGGLISYEEYTPYGSSCFQAGRSAAEVSLKRYRYTGRERDAETGFGYHGARYYAPWLGRWVACDPAGLVDGPNLYQYARSNPCRMADPSGTEAEVVEDHNALKAPAVKAPSEQGAAAKPAPTASSAPSLSATPPASGTSTTAAAPATTTMGNEEAKAEAPRGPTRLHHTPGLHGETKIQWQNWKERNWLSWVLAAVFLLGALAILIPAVRFKKTDPYWYRVLQIGATIGWVALVATRLIMEGTVSKPKPGEAPKWDKQFGDPWWTTIHTLTGVIMGLWQVPFPLVMAFTMLWEGLEISVPGFGDEEINGNRLTDIGVAWLGWAVFAGMSAAVTKQPFPFGVRGSDYTRDRHYGSSLQQWGRDWF